MKDVLVCKIGDISDVFVGGDCPNEYSTEKTDEFSVPIFSNGIENEGLYGYTKKAKVGGDSITISARGVNIGAVFYRKNPFYPIVRLLSLVPNKEKVYPKYLYYNLKLSSILGSGSAQPQITAPQIKKQKIICFSDVVKQKKIADILSTYDNLIKNNNKRIAFLEKAAQELYKEWFVRFRFPGYENIELKDSALGHIPENFDVVKMSDVLSYYIGGGWGEEDESTSYPCDAYVIRGTDFPKIQSGDWSTCPYRYHKKSNYEARKIGPWDIVLEVSGGTQEQPVGRTLIVTPDLLKALSDKVICASFCKQLRCDINVISPIYYYYWMQFLYDTRIIDKFQLQSTGIINFKFEYFHRKGDVLLPPKHLMDEFEDKVKNLFKLKDDLASQNKNLIKQRDLLLPRLMSGKLEV